MRNLSIVTALALCAACQSAPKTETASMGDKPVAEPAGFSAEDEAAIRAVDAEWARAVAAGDANALTAVYSSDASLLPPNEPVAKGEAMKKYNADMLNSFSGSIDLTTTFVEGRGDLAYAVGTYRAKLTPKKAGSKPLPTEDGKYIEVLKKQADGSWKIVYDMWSANAPAGKQ